MYLVRKFSWSPERAVSLSSESLFHPPTGGQRRRKDAKGCFSLRLCAFFVRQLADETNSLNYHELAN